MGWGLELGLGLRMRHRGANVQGHGGRRRRQRARPQRALKRRRVLQRGEAAAHIWVHFWVVKARRIGALGQASRPRRRARASYRTLGGSAARPGLGPSHCPGRATHAGRAGRVGPRPGAGASAPGGQGSESCGAAKTALCTCAGAVRAHHAAGLDVACTQPAEQLGRAEGPLGEG